MGNMRTLAFQVPEELFQQIKDYLQRNNMTQKEFVIGLIETEINRDLSQRATQATTEQNADVSCDLSEVSAEVGEEPEEQENAAPMFLSSLILSLGCSSSCKAKATKSPIVMLCSSMCFETRKELDIGD